MLPQHVLVALVAAVSAVPLNINLGAYSPALVVGDGEISLGNAGAASELMATLASGAAAGGGAGQQRTEVPAEAPPAEAPPAEQPAERRTAKRSVDLSRRNTEDHMLAVSEAMQWIKRDLPGFNAALQYAREAMKNSPKIEMGSEGAGVGIVVNAGVDVPATSAANGAKPPGQAAEKKAKRAEVVEESEAPKMTLVAITEV